MMGLQSSITCSWDYKDMKCLMCGEKEETVAHICESKEVEKKINTRLVETLKEWKGHTKRENLECKVENSLKSKLVIILCEYIANFKRIVRKAKEEVERARNRSNEI